MAFSRDDMFVLSQGKFKVWGYQSADALTYDADGYFVNDTANVGDIILAMRTGTTSFVWLIVTAKAADGTLTVAKEANPTLT